jgi:hypothetical protein
MKKTALFILAAGVVVLTTLPVNAQKKVTAEPVKKEAQQVQQSQAVADPAPPAKRINPGMGTPVKSPAAKNKPGTAASVTPVATTASAAASPAAPANPAAAAPAVPAAPPVPLTCTWDVIDYDFGKSVVQLKPASATFNMTNAGKEPVTITQVQTSCGCTSPKYTKEPIKPGEKGEVVLTYNAAISGFFSKSAQVKLNDGQKYSLTIKGEVQKVETTPAVAPPAEK